MGKNELMYLFCPGAQKSGTSYLFNLLKQHEEICFSRFKELHFFTWEKTYERGIEDFHSKFTPNEKTRYIADFTPMYLTDPRALAKISRHFKNNVKMIVLLRDPIKRGFSQYNMKANKGKEKRKFHSIVESETKDKNIMKSITGRGLYSVQLDNLFKYFDREQVYIKSFEDFINDKEGTIDEILAFLKLENKYPVNYDVFQNSRENSRAVGLSKLIYKIPLYIRRPFYDKSKLLNKLVKRIIKKGRREHKTESHLEQRSINLLREYYRESNRIVAEKYMVNTDAWL